MARTWFALGLLLVVLLGCLAVTALVDKHTDTATHFIQQAQNAADQKNFSEALRLCNKAISFWEDNSGILSSFLRHEDSGTVEMELQQLKSFAESESLESFRATCSQLIAQMEHIRDNERPLLQNIL